MTSLFLVLLWELTSNEKGFEFNESEIKLLDSIGAVKVQRVWVGYPVG